MSAAGDVRIAVAGAGYWGKNHVRNLASLPGATLAAVCDPDPSALARAARMAPGARMVAELDDLLRDGSVQAVVLATPAADHGAQGKALLAAGKDVLVEKPLALDARAAGELCALADGNGRILMVGHLMRFHPGIERLAEIVASGELGEVRYAYASRVNLGKLRRDENALWSLGPHDVSILLALFGQMPDTVAARGAAYLQAGVEDVVFINLSFPDGRMAQVQVSWLDPHKERKLTVVGSRKMVVFDDTRRDETLKIFDKGYDAPPDYRTFGEFLTLRDGDVHIPRVALGEPLAAELAHFVHCVRTRERPRTSGAEGLAVVRILEAAQASLAGGGTPISLPASGA